MPTPEIVISDCNGIPGGKSVIDCCGVCGGDGTSCPELCQEIDNAAVKKKIRSEAKRVIDDTLRRISRELQCQRKSKAAKRRKIETLEMKRQIRFLVSGIEDHVKLCSTSFCLKSSYAELNSEIESTLQKIVTVNKLSQRQAKKACCRNGVCAGSGVSGPNRRAAFSTLVSELPEQRCD